jgi:hypothetical protein
VNALRNKAAQVEEQRAPILRQPVDSIIRPVAEPRGAAAGSDLLGAAGLVLTLVAMVHLALVWIPLHLGTAPWEFAAATQTTDVLPLAAVGVALLGWSAIQAGRRWLMTMLAVWCGVSALLVLVVAGLLMLALPIAWQSVEQPIRDSLIKTTGKNMAFCLIFFGYYAWLTVRLLRTARARNGVSR